ncbi:hypothetical protein [Sphingorhabdus sp. Alg231-15]|uniref:hypothetical protein n=1 Tax=Sphingorhabdus sp. Alg231-15 TaxID=1922222 RepID=UPI00307B3663
MRNNSNDLSYERKADLLRHIHYENAELQGLDVGKTYQVFGLVFRDNVPWYYLDADSSGYPTPYPFHYFKPTELAIPSNWRMVVRQLDIYRFETSILPEFWAEDSSVYERVLDDDPDAIEKFKALMDD